jgi:hypothetical protein
MISKADIRLLHLNDGYGSKPDSLLALSRALRCKSHLSGRAWASIQDSRTGSWCFSFSQTSRGAFKGLSQPPDFRCTDSSRMGVPPTVRMMSVPWSPPDVESCQVGIPDDCQTCIPLILTLWGCKRLHGVGGVGFQGVAHGAPENPPGAVSPWEASKG